MVNSLWKTSPLSTPCEGGTLKAFSLTSPLIPSLRRRGKRGGYKFMFGNFKIATEVTGYSEDFFCIFCVLCGKKIAEGLI